MISKKRNEVVGEETRNLTYKFVKEQLDLAKTVAEANPEPRLDIDIKIVYGIRGSRLCIWVYSYEAMEGGSGCDVVSAVEDLNNKPTMVDKFGRNKIKVT